MRVSGHSQFWKRCPTVLPSRTGNDIRYLSSHCCSGKALLVRDLSVSGFPPESQRLQEVNSIVFPVCEPLQLRSRFAEEFQLHLFEFSGTENEVSRGDFVTEGFTYLCDTKRDLFSGSSLYILKVYEDPLCCFRSQDRSQTENLP